VSSVNSDHLATTEQDIERDSEELEDCFGEIADCTSDIIMKKGVEVSGLKTRLASLSVHNKKLHEEFLEDIWSQIGDATIEDVWYKLGKYWDFLNYSLLEHLVKKFGDEALKARMKTYKKKLENFLSKTRLCDFIEHFKHVNKSLVRENFWMFEVKLKKDWEECTLEDLEHVKRNITQKLFFPSFSLVLKDFNSGCVSVTWAIPAVFATSLMENMESMDLSNFCEEHGIISMVIDGVEFYPPLGPNNNPDTNPKKEDVTGQLTHIVKVRGV